MKQVAFGVTVLLSVATIGSVVYDLNGFLSFLLFTATVLASFVSGSWSGMEKAGRTYMDEIERAVILRRLAEMRSQACEDDVDHRVPQ